MNEYGSGGEISVEMNGPFSGGGGTSSKLTIIHAAVADWKGGTSPYSQVVQVDGISLNSKVDIQISPDMLGQLYNQDIVFTTENRGGEVTLIATGDRPAVDCEFQATVSEIVAIGVADGSVIRGNAISTNAPRTDLNQDDPAGADFLKGREKILDMIKTEQATLSSGGWGTSPYQQTVDVAGVMADSNKQAIISVSDPGSLETYLDCNIRLIDNGEGTLTYACDDAPTTDVKVNILILTKGGV